MVIAVEFLFLPFTSSKSILFDIVSAIVLMLSYVLVFSNSSLLFSSLHTISVGYFCLLDLLCWHGPCGIDPCGWPTQELETFLHTTTPKQSNNSNEAGRDNYREINVMEE